MMSKINTIADFFKFYRKNTYYSQAELGKILKVSGQYISNIERGIEKTPISLCRKLMKHLNIKYRDKLEELLMASFEKKLERLKKCTNHT